MTTPNEILHKATDCGYQVEFIFEKSKVNYILRAPGGNRYGRGLHAEGWHFPNSLDILFDSIERTIEELEKKQVSA